MKPFDLVFGMDSTKEKKCNLSTIRDNNYQIYYYYYCKRLQIDFKFGQLILCFGICIKSFCLPNQ
ncbi:hypothetical protein BLOT_002105 [Blomia tropicalis]|nr:hypothetical protein BLOT_002105 [Blomia tropicalis]